MVPYSSNDRAVQLSGDALNTLPAGGELAGAEGTLVSQADVWAVDCNGTKRKSTSAETFQFCSAHVSIYSTVSAGLKLNQRATASANTSTGAA